MSKQLWFFGDTEMSVAEIQAESTNGTSDKKEKKPGVSRNKFLKGVNYDMLHNQFIDKDESEPSKIYNREYVYEKLEREYIVPLKVTTEAEWIKLAGEAWNFYSNKSERQKLQEIESVVSKFDSDDDAIQLLERILNERKKALSKSQPDNSTDTKGKKSSTNGKTEEELELEALPN